MASGKTPYICSLRVNQIAPSSSTTSDVFEFSGNNERHLLLVTGPGSGQRTIYMIGDSSQGAAWCVEMGTAGTGLTITTGTRQLTIAHNNASMLYLDFCFAGNFLSLAE